MIFNITQISNIHPEMSIKANDPLSSEPTIEVLLPSLSKFIGATVQSSAKGTTSQYFKTLIITVKKEFDYVCLVMLYLITCITLITVFVNSSHSEIGCKLLICMIQLLYFTSKLIFSRDTCPVWFSADCCGAHLFSIVHNQLLWCWHFQYGLQLIGVVWFTVNCCGVNMLSVIYSQLLCCSHFQ